MCFLWIMINTLRSWEATCVPNLYRVILKQDSGYFWLIPLMSLNLSQLTNDKTVGYFFFFAIRISCGVLSCRKRVPFHEYILQFVLEKSWMCTNEFIIQPCKQVPHSVVSYSIKGFTFKGHIFRFSLWLLKSVILNTVKKWILRYHFDRP